MPVITLLPCGSCCRFNLTWLPFFAIFDVHFFPSISETPPTTSLLLLVNVTGHWVLCIIITPSFILMLLLQCARVLWPCICPHRRQPWMARFGCIRNWSVQEHRCDACYGGSTLLQAHWGMETSRHNRSACIRTNFIGRHFVRQSGQGPARVRVGL